MRFTAGSYMNFLPVLCRYYLLYGRDQRNLKFDILYVASLQGDAVDCGQGYCSICQKFREKDSTGEQIVEHSKVGSSALSPSLETASCRGNQHTFFSKFIIWPK